MKANGAAGLATGILLAMLLAACSGGGAEATTTSAAAAATPVKPTVAVAATEPDAPGLFTGSDRCRQTTAPEPSASPDPDTLYLACERTASDPRMSGSSVGELRGVSSNSTQDDPALYSLYGTETLTNDGGSWDCEVLAVWESDTWTGWRDQVCVGHGDYIGLSAYVHAIGNDAITSYGVLGWIEKTP